MESGTQLHAIVNEATKLLLNVPTQRLEALVEKHARRRFAAVPAGPGSARSSALGVGLPAGSQWSVVRLRDL